MAVKFNPLPKGFDLTGAGSSSSPDNFSYKKIDTSETKVIPENQQMIVDGHILVNGHLTVLGSLIDISKRVANNFFYDLIRVDEVVEIESNRLLLYKDHLTVLGHLRVNGRMTET